MGLRESVPSCFPVTGWAREVFAFPKEWFCVVCRSWVEVLVSLAALPVSSGSVVFRSGRLPDSGGRRPGGAAVVLPFPDLSGCGRRSPLLRQ